MRNGAVVRAASWERGEVVEQTIPLNRASLRAMTPPRNLVQVTDSLRDGERVPVRSRLSNPNLL